MNPTSTDIVKCGGGKLMKFDWPFPTHPGPFYRFANRAIITMVASTSRIWLEWLNRPNIINKDQFMQAFHDRSRPLITVSNHHSCIDDPCMWGLMSWKDIVSRPFHCRWTLVASDVTFAKSWHRKFFSKGRNIPVVRGGGVYQRGVEYATELLNNSEWVHVFVQGKINMSQLPMRIKWGVGQIINDCRIQPRVIPIWHVGFEDILPNSRPYIPQINKDVTIMFGDAIEIDDILDDLRSQNAPHERIRKCLTDRIQDELYRLQPLAESAHNDHLKLFNKPPKEDASSKTHDEDNLKT